jgi:hypothetical protein
MNSLSQVAIIAIIFFACYKTIEIFVRRRERLNIVDKISEISSLNTENMQFLLSSGKLNFGKYTPLRLGCAIAGIGLGLLIAFMIVRLNFGYINGDTDWYIRNMISTIYGASSLLFGGVALIICFLIERSENKK